MKLDCDFYSRDRGLLAKANLLRVLSMAMFGSGVGSCLIGGVSYLNGKWVKASTTGKGVTSRDKPAGTRIFIINCSTLSHPTRLLWRIYAPGR